MRAIIENSVYVIIVVDGIAFLISTCCVVFTVAALILNGSYVLSTAACWLFFLYI